MKRIFCLLWCAAGVSFGAAGQSFLNLDFEAANVTTDAVFVSWAFAIPDWNHSSGADVNNFVYHLAPHTNTTQYYFLVDAYSTTPLVPLDGNYSVALSSGYFGANQTGGFVHAYLSQLGLVPSNAVAFTILCTSSNLGVQIDSTTIPMVYYGDNLYGGDISAFAGAVHTLRVINNSDLPQDPIEIDDLGFSSSPAPEPGTLALMAAGLGVGFAAARRGRRSGGPGSAS